MFFADDDVSLCKLMSAFLQRAGYTVNLVHDGLAAIEHIRTHNPRLVVLDIMLPEKDGFSVCRAVRANYNGSIIMFTALDTEVDEVAGLELGADDYIKKPISPRLLLASAYP